MKREKLVKHLLQQGCELPRQGARPSVFVNRQARRSSTAPRHREINDFLAMKISRDLGVPEP